MKIKIGKHHFIKATFIMGLLLTLSDVSYAKRQFAMEAALKKLQQAEIALKRVQSDKTGHKERALKLIQKAEKEIRSAIEVANRRPAGGHYK